MHPDLKFLIVADEQDRKIRTLRKKKRSLEQTLANAIERESSTQKSASDLTENVASNKARQHELQRMIVRYEARLTSANRVLEGGGGDPEAAERQVISVTAMLDTFETELLEHMEELESLEESLFAAREALANASKFLTVERANQPGALQALSDAYQAILPVRTAALKEVDASLALRYENFLSRKGRAVAEIIKRCCSACQMDVRQQSIADIERGLLQTCGACGRWLVLDAHSG